MESIKKIKRVFKSSLFKNLILFLIKRKKNTTPKKIKIILCNSL